jgi:hypothetical protein
VYMTEGYVTHRYNREGSQQRELVWSAGVSLQECQDQRGTGPC